MQTDSKDETIAILDIADCDGTELLRRLAELGLPEDTDTQSGVVELQNATGGDNLLMGLDRPWKINVRGPLGNYALAYNQHSFVRVAGSVGDGLGESMMSGAIRIHGNAGVGVGVGMSGGTIAVYGNAGDGCATALHGGEVFVRGSVGHNAANGALHGTLVIGGDAGNNLGEAMMDATIFIRGNIQSIGHGIVETELNEGDKIRLGLLLINAGIRGDASDFRRVVPQHIQDEAQKRSGVIGHPSWR